MKYSNMDNTVRYRNHFDRELAFYLIDLESKRKAILNKVVIAKVLNVLTLTLFLSVFMGFLNAFPFDKFGMGILTFFFNGFFYLVLSIIVFVLLFKAIKYFLLLIGVKEVLKNLRLLYLYTTVAALITMLAAWTIGKFYLGTEIFSIQFFSRYFIAIISIIVIGFLGNYFGKFEIRFNETFKLEYLLKILNFFNKDIQFQPKNFVKQTAFDERSLFRCQKIYSYKGSDYVSGSYGEGNFAFSQLHVKEYSKTYSGGKTKTKISYLFKGLFYEADFNKSFSGLTIIYPDYARMALGEQFGEMLNQKLGFENTQLVTLEETEFEKEFAVFSNDQVEARYILTPTMIERIKKVKFNLEKDIYLAFVKNKVYMAIPYNLDLFSPLIFHNLTSFETIEPVYQIIGCLMDIANDLHLNTRIWGEV